jgi:hypothetical protein
MKFHFEEDAMKAIALTAALCAGTAAANDLPCADRGVITTMLETEYGEVSIGYGYEVRDVVVEIYVSQGATWSLLVTTPNGRSCVIATGTDWVFIEQPWPKSGDLN